MNESALMREGKNVVGILKENGFNEEAMRLAHELSAVSDPELGLDAITNIKNMCHVRWLGDKYIKTRELLEWYDDLSKLEKAADKTRKKLIKQMNEK